MNSKKQSIETLSTIQQKSSTTQTKHFLSVSVLCLILSNFLICVCAATCTTSSANLVSSTIPLTDTSSNLLGNDISNHFTNLPNNQTEQLNVNDFLTTTAPDHFELNEQATKKLNAEMSTQIDQSHTFFETDHNYTNLKRPCSFNSVQNSTANNSASNICSNKVKKVNS